MGLVKGAAIFGLGAAFGLMFARNRPDFRNKNSPDCPLQKKMNKAREMKRAKELDKVNTPDSDVTPAQIPAANSTLNPQPNYQ